MKTKLPMIGGAAVLSLLSVMQLADAANVNNEQIARGRYLVATSGCNDCHTVGYPQADGNIPVERWLTGSPVGFQGPWGTTYPANLRISLGTLNEEQWLQKARAPMRPPMPWVSLRDMSDNDLLAIYQFVRSLKPAGEAAPPYVGPDQAVNTPYYDFMPKNLPKVAQVAK